MTLGRVATWLLVGSVCVALASCRMKDDDDDHEDNDDVEQVDTGDRVCDPGSTQQCWGPGACAGAQVCELHGLSWGPCDCGNGSGDPVGAAGADGGDVAGAAGADSGIRQIGGAGAAGASSGPPSACDDGMLNGDESDIDCGGSCPPCAEGHGCVRHADCESLVCRAGTCQVPVCTDATMNGDETDVDCGGATCPQCAAGMSCLAGADCDSGSCSNGACDA